VSCWEPHGKNHPLADAQPVVRRRRIYWVKKLGALRRLSSGFGHRADTRRLP